MAPASVFIGLVSHEKSSFVLNQGSIGLAASLQLALANSGVDCQLQVNTTNFFDEDAFPLTPKMARESVREEIRLESQWFEFLERGDKLAQFGRILGRRAHFILNWKRNSQDHALRRLLNIEYSHMDLYRRAVRSGASWAIILEDDASASFDVRELANELLGWITVSSEPDLQSKMINLSGSFTLDELGVRHLLRPLNGFRWAGNSGRTVLGARKPATNTVCAIAFRIDFLAEILADFDSQPTFPVVPIDWKLNATLMRLYQSGSIRAEECLFIEPAPIVQLSMVRDRAAK